MWNSRLCCSPVSPVISRKQHPVRAINTTTYEASLEGPSSLPKKTVAGRGRAALVRATVWASVPVWMRPKRDRSAEGWGHSWCVHQRRAGRCWFCNPARFDVLGLLVHLDFLLANLSSKDFEVKSRSYLCDSWPRCGRLVALIVPVQHLKKALLLYPGPTAWSTILQDDSRQDRPPSRLLYSSFDVPWQA